ncbi:Uma2 family endonuclease [Nitrosococcus wardiae]|uniref:Uma2 family endonuclease n=1 Tax=Nitrosococcus wardiae TaxID=1814290 RepID=A0A4P7C5J1_9GAMM|nr:Uma2 family endonuclease [Nitrosococcus wardiae]QBQ56276.1 Uma2 family endonuclease [Nitrosococcus wardiae]
MRWSEVLQDKSLRELPYKIELNEYGKIVMTPASNRHGYLQSKISYVLRQNVPEGEVISECAIDTEKGVKVADVAWCSDEFMSVHGFETPYSEAPEVCVEILSPSNSHQEMKDKMALYFQQGAKEVWLVSEKGEVRYFDSQGELDRSFLGFRIIL